MMTEKTIYPLPDINYLKLRFRLISGDNADLPEFKGSLLRGAFGHALRKTVCAMSPGTLCAHCMLKQQCAYTRLFETFIIGEPPRFLRGLDTALRPFIIEPFDTDKIYKKGDTLSFDLLLIGSAIDFVPYVVFAIYQMAQNGLGARRHPFELSRADCCQPPPGTPENESCWCQLYDAATQTLLFAPAPLTLSDSEFQILNPVSRISLRFRTTTRLKFKGDYTMDFNFRNLVFKMLRRVLELAYFYMPEQEIDWEFHHLLVAADDVEIAERNLRWSDWQRYSNRQKSKIKMGGFVGDLVLEGELTPFMELLHYAEVLHVGKGSVFGLGEVEVDHQS
ncbi:CRISPR system precrRNA processing endoribonuclease RAMP protein Cas6 [candidate division KSB1 bacterium]|nr:CRISPR system precrRNA processing endoribonuclease RAMP protein Cas6 [candidate division KSB1 bacterium]